MQNVQLNGKRHAVPMSIDLGGTSKIMPPGGVDDNSSFTVKDLLQVVWRRMWVVMLVATVLTSVTVGVSLMQTPTYSASIKLLVGQNTDDSASSNLGGDVSGLQQITQTVAEAVSTRPVAEGVVQQLGLQESPESILANMNAEQIGATQFIEVSYQDTSPEKAQQVVNTIGGVFSEQVSKVSANTNDITATVWEEAVVPESPISPTLLQNGLLALALGIMLGLGLAFLLEHLDDHWRSSEEVEQISEVPTFGVVPAFKVVESKKRGKGS